VAVAVAEQIVRRYIARRGAALRCAVEGAIRTRRSVTRDKIAATDDAIYRRGVRTTSLIHLQQIILVVCSTSERESAENYNK